jgi:hypothetical protein
MWLGLLQRHLHTHVFAALFTIAKLWKQPRCPTTYKWIKKMWHLYTMEFYSWRRMKSYYSQVNGWDWRTSSKAKLARLRKPKIICCPSYADFRSKTNTIILLDMVHTLRGEHIQEEYGKVGNPKLESVWCAHYRGANTPTLKRQRSIGEGGWEAVKRSGRDESVQVVIHLCMECYESLCIVIHISN